MLPGGINSCLGYSFCFLGGLRTRGILFGGMMGALCFGDLQLVIPKILFRGMILGQEKGCVGYGCQMAGKYGPGLGK